MLYDRVIRYGRAGVVAAIVIAGIFAIAQAQENYVLIQADEDRLFLPYALAEPIQFADSALLKGPSCTVDPEIDLACQAFDAISINRAFFNRHPVHFSTAIYSFFL